MRPIAANNNAPSEKMAKWLLERFRKLNPPRSFEVKNSLDLVHRLKNIKVKRNETMVSFDVEALYPSIPRKQALDFLEIWLQNEHVAPVLQKIYIMMTRICIEQSTVQFRGKYYKQNAGVSMGNPISSFVANLFMSFFETNVSNNKNFPRVWFRYVDDVFAIMNQRKIGDCLEAINNQYESIKFTMELEQHGRLPFLEIMIEREDDGNISFDIYRKPTFIPRYITSDSFHSNQHKKAAFNAMIHRMVYIPLSNIKRRTEYTKICEIAEINGYDKKWIDEIVKKIERNKRRKDLTTLTPMQSERSQKRVAITYFPQITNELQKVLSGYEVQLVHKNNNRTRRKVGNCKDKCAPLQRSGIYEITCNDCNEKYIGQSRRRIEKRFKEHVSAKNNNKPELSAVAKHLLDEDHNITKENLKLLKEVNDERKLNIYESIAIQKNNPSMNEDSGPHLSTLFNLLTKRQNCNPSNRTTS